MQKARSSGAARESPRKKDRVRPPYHHRCHDSVRTAVSRTDRTATHPPDILDSRTRRIFGIPGQAPPVRLSSRLLTPVFVGPNHPGGVILRLGICDQLSPLTSLQRRLAALRGIVWAGVFSGPRLRCGRLNGGVMDQNWCGCLPDSRPPLDRMGTKTRFSASCLQALVCDQSSPASTRDGQAGR